MCCTVLWLVMHQPIILIPRDSRSLHAKGSPPPNPHPGSLLDLSLQDSPPPIPKRIRRHCKCLKRANSVACISANRYRQYSDSPSITHARYRLAGIQAITFSSSFRSRPASSQ